MCSSRLCSRMGVAAARVLAWGQSPDPCQLAEWMAADMEDFSSRRQTHKGHRLLSLSKSTTYDAKGVYVVHGHICLGLCTTPSQGVSPCSSLQRWMGWHVAALAAWHVHVRGRQYSTAPGRDHTLHVHCQPRPLWRPFAMDSCCGFRGIHHSGRATAILVSLIRRNVQYTTLTPDGTNLLHHPTNPNAVLGRLWPTCLSAWPRPVHVIMHLARPRRGRGVASRRSTCMSH